LNRRISPLISFSVYFRSNCPFLSLRSPFLFLGCEILTAIEVICGAPFSPCALPFPASPPQFLDHFVVFSALLISVLVVSKNTYNRKKKTPFFSTLFFSLSLVLPEMFLPFLPCHASRTFRTLQANQTLFSFSVLGDRFFSPVLVAPPFFPSFVVDLLPSLPLGRATVLGA